MIIIVQFKIPVLHFIYLSVYYLFHFWIGIKVKHRNDNHCSVKIPVLHLIYLSMYYLFFVPCFCQQRIQIGGADYLIGRFLSRDRFLYICWAYWFTNSEWIFGNVLNERTSMLFGPCILIRTGTLIRQPRVWLYMYVCMMYRVFFFYTQISFPCHFYTNQDIGMRFFATCSGHRVVFLLFFSLLQDNIQRRYKRY